MGYHFVASVLGCCWVGKAFLAPRSVRHSVVRWAATKKRVVFLGSPAVAAKTLESLLEASQHPEASFQVVGCVSQPAAAKGRKKVVQPCEVQALAEERGVRTLTPAAAKDPHFLENLAKLAPDLCITAAFGQFLPRAFLEIPVHGTWNIHPSLLPKYRGAAPLQRSLQAGDEVVGVTVLETVLKMDAGPIVAQMERPVRPDDTAEALLEELFLSGLDLLLANLDDCWRGAVRYAPQDEDQATHAPKLNVAEARLEPDLILLDDSRSVALRAAHQVRAFAPWPGTWLEIRRRDETSRLKVLAARVADGPPPDGTHLALVDNNALRLRCADGSALDLTLVQPPNRKPMDARAFW